MTSKPEAPAADRSLSPEDYAVLGARYGVPDSHLAIKEKVLADLISFQPRTAQWRTGADVRSA